VSFILRNNQTSTERTFDTLDACYRHILDSRLRYWSIFQDGLFVIGADTHYIPSIDGEAA